MTAHYTENVLVKNEKTCVSLLATYAAFNVLAENYIKGILAFMLNDIPKINQILNSWNSN